MPLFLSWLAVLSWAGLIFGLSHIPSLNSGLGVWDLIFRKLAHIIEYFIFTGLLIGAFRRTWTHDKDRKIIIWSCVFAILYAVSDEFHQSFVPGRGPSVLDVGIDTIGVFLMFINYKRYPLKGLLMSLLAFSLVSCGPDFQFNKARKKEDQGKYSEAWTLYQEFVAKNTKHFLAPEALFRAGWMAQQGLEDCHVATVFYDKVRTQYPQSEPWARAATLQAQNCPDYFPLIPGSQWEEGDSDTKGYLARTLTKCLALKQTKNVIPSQAGELVRETFAGRKKVFSNSYVYKKENKALNEYFTEDDSRSKPILKWPLTVGRTWRTRLQGRFFNFEIISLNETVKVKAGTFENCLKVRSAIERSPGARFEYYAPGVGRVLTTLSSQKGEKRNTELMSYKIADFPGFSTNKGKKKK